MSVDIARVVMYERLDEPINIDGETIIRGSKTTIVNQDDGDIAITYREEGSSAAGVTVYLRPEMQKAIADLVNRGVAGKATRHVLFKHEHCDAPGSCQFCDGGLSLCTVCGGAEGSMPTDCPGEKMSHELSDKVYNGIVDFVDGRWVPGRHAE